LAELVLYSLVLESRVRELFDITASDIRHTGYIFTSRSNGHVINSDIKELEYKIRIYITEADDDRDLM
jgi:hypothetical protein